MTYTAPTGQDAGDTYFDVNKFEELLSRLEASKGRQQRQKSVEGRRDIYAQGLASMMSNFWFFCIIRKPWPVAYQPVNQILMTGLI